jgi:hypothetical protein
MVTGEVVGCSFSQEDGSRVRPINADLQAAKFWCTIREQRDFRYARNLDLQT